MKVYINNKYTSEWEIQKVEILPNNTPTKDESLETFSFVLISNTISKPYAPMQKVKVDFKGDGTDIAYFYIVSDSVETFSLKPLKYKHSISCVQNIRELSKHLVRNSVFTQPSYLSKSSYNAMSQITGTIDEAVDNIQTWNPTGPQLLNEFSEPLTLNKREKIKKVYFRFSFQCIINKTGLNYLYANLKTKDDISDHTNYQTLILHQNFKLKYTDSSGNPQTPISIGPSTFGVSFLEFGKEYEFPLVNELYAQGYNNFELLFDDEYSVIFTKYNNGQLTYHNTMVFWMAQLEIVAETYYWSCYDVLQLLTDRQIKETQYSSDSRLFFLPEWTNGENPEEDKLYTLLKTTIAPNFTFTQLTMFECVAEVFRVFDAIFTMDENKKLGIEYFNDLSGEVITNKKFTGRTIALGEDKYTNGLVSNYQDARIEEKFPKDGGFSHLRSAEFGVPQETDHNFIVPHNIDSIVKCEVVVTDISYGLDPTPLNPSDDVPLQQYFIALTDDNESSTFYTGKFVIDISRYVIEQSIWSMLNENIPDFDEENDRIIKKANSIYFTRGDNKIQCAFSGKTYLGINYYSFQQLVKSALIRMAGIKLAYTLDQDNVYLKSNALQPYGDDFKGGWYKVRMRLSYMASVDGRMKTHSLTNKYEGETLIDQNNGAVDLNKLGLNMLGLSLKMGNPTLNATHKISRWENRIKTGQLYEWNGGLWVANIVNYTFFGGFIQGKISFVQNFNELALRTKLLREKRMSNISKELTQKSEEILTDFVYFSSEEIESNGTATKFDRDELKNFIYDSFKANGPFSKLPDFFIYDYYQVPLDGNTKAIYIPTIRYGAGNTINFEMSFDHPMNAGNQTTYKSGKYSTQYVNYTANDNDEMVIYLSDTQNRVAEGFLDKVDVISPRDTEPYDTDFPIVTIHVQQPTSNAYIDIRNFYVYKQPNEIFALNYQLAFLPIPGRELIDFIGSEWINNNCFVKDLQETKKPRYIVFKSEKSSNLDIKATPYFLKKEITNLVLASSDSTHFALTFGFATLTQEEKELDDFISWAIIDERDNVLFASNKELDLENTLNEVVIYFIARSSRVPDPIPED